MDISVKGFGFPGDFVWVLCDFFGFLGEFFLDFPPISCIVTWVTQPERPKGAQRTNPSRSKGPNNSDIMSKPAPQWGVVVVARCGRQGSLGLRLSWAVNWYIAVSLLLGRPDIWSDDQMVKWWQDSWPDGQMVAGQMIRWSNGDRTVDQMIRWWEDRWSPQTLTIPRSSGYWPTDRYWYWPILNITGELWSLKCREKVERQTNGLVDSILAISLLTKKYLVRKYFLNHSQKSVLTAPVNVNQGDTLWYALQSKAG